METDEDVGANFKDAQWSERLQIYLYWKKNKNKNNELPQV